jgi:hypothetical protein
VDAIVDLRRHRDGLVETPAQYKYAALALQLPDPSYCSASCTLSKVSAKVVNSTFYLPFLAGISVAFLFIGFLFIFFILRNKAWGKVPAFLSAENSNEKYIKIPDVAIPASVRKRRNYQSSENEIVRRSES